MEAQVRDVILLTGVMAAGKSTIAQHLAERLPLSVHLRGDVFRRMIVNGRAEMAPGFTESAWEQLRLRYRLATAASDLYCAAGFTVIYQDVIIGPVLREVVEQLRAKVGYSSWTPAELDHELRTNTPRVGLWLDTSALSVEETVATILARLNEAVVQG
jgi:predicted kinase